MSDLVGKSSRLTPAGERKPWLKRKSSPSRPYLWRVLSCPMTVTVDELRRVGLMEADTGTE